MTKEAILAERYAKALLSIGIDKESFESLAVELNRVDELFKTSSELKLLFQHPRFNREIRKKILGELLERVIVSPTCRSFMFLLVDQGRIKYLRAIIKTYHELVDLHLHRTQAVVTVARQLEEDERTQLIESLTALTGKEVLLEEK